MEVKRSKGEDPHSSTKQMAGGPLSTVHICVPLLRARKHYGHIAQQNVYDLSHRPSKRHASDFVIGFSGAVTGN